MASSATTTEVTGSEMDPVAAAVGAELPADFRIANYVIVDKAVTRC
jgi:hypothetical protein